ncbi:MAG: enoyl-CoA hydratase/isomerase family protein [Gemmatimonadales bacterium]
MSVSRSVENGVGRLVLDHPPLNILTSEMLENMCRELNDLRGLSDLRALVLSAKGRHFSAGADVGEHLPPHYAGMISRFMDTVRAIDTFPVPVVAAVRGRCLGGGFELIQVADIVVAGEGATFGQPEIKLGVFPPAACAVLPSVCGSARAMELVLTGESIGADEALAAGLVRYVTADDEVEARAMEIARAIAVHSAAAVRLATEAMKSSRTAAREASFRCATRRYVDDLMQTGDAVEGLQAFLEKRQPVWSHR